MPWLSEELDSQEWLAVSFTLISASTASTRSKPTDCSMDPPNDQLEDVSCVTLIRWVIDCPVLALPDTLDAGWPSASVTGAHVVCWYCGAALGVKLRSVADSNNLSALTACPLSVAASMTTIWPGAAAGRACGVGAVPLSVGAAPVPDGASPPPSGCSSGW